MFSPHTDAITAKRIKKPFWTFNRPIREKKKKKKKTLGMFPPPSTVISSDDYNRAGVLHTIGINKLARMSDKHVKRKNFLLNERA